MLQPLSFIYFFVRVDTSDSILILTPFTHPANSLCQGDSFQTPLSFSAQAPACSMANFLLGPTWPSEPGTKGASAKALEDWSPELDLDSELGCGFPHSRAFTPLITAYCSPRRALGSWVLADMEREKKHVLFEATSRKVAIQQEMCRSSPEGGDSTD